MHDHHSLSISWSLLRTWTTCGLAGLLALGVPATVVEAQSLADVARQEAERRRAVKAEAKVYTNRDLGPAAIRPPASPADAAVAEQAPETAAESTPGWTGACAT